MFIHMVVRSHMVTPMVGHCSVIEIGVFLLILFFYRGYSLVKLNTRISFIKRLLFMQSGQIK